MKKTLALASIVFSALFSTNLSAQSLTINCIAGSSVASISTNLITLTINTIQTTSPGHVQTFSNPLDFYLGGTGSETIGLLYFWDQPSTATPLTFTIGSGNTINVTNNATTAQTAHVQVEYGPYITAQNGTAVLIPAGGSADLQIPSGGGSFNVSNQQFYGQPNPFMVVHVVN